MSLRRAAVRLSPALLQASAARLAAARLTSMPSVGFAPLQPRRFFLSPPGSKSGAISIQPSPDGKGTIPVVLVSDYKKIKGEFGAVVDVRQPEEVAEGAIPGSVNIPLADVISNPNQSSLKGKKVLVYCKAGIRSAKAVAALQAAGIDAVNLGGGYMAWQGDK